MLFVQVRTSKNWKPPRKKDWGESKVSPLVCLCFCKICDMTRKVNHLVEQAPAWTRPKCDRPPEESSSWRLTPLSLNGRNPLDIEPHRTLGSPPRGQLPSAWLTWLYLRIDFLLLKGGDKINDLSKSKALKEEEKDDILDLKFARGGSSSLRRYKKKWQAING